MPTDLVLASTSPRRRELLNLFGLPFSLFSPDIDETLEAGHAPELEVLRLATEKAEAGGASNNNAYTIGADTLVTVSGRIFGKPTSPEEALDMLRTLRDREHEVVTGVAVAHEGAVWNAWRFTRVQMRPYTEEELQAYVGSGAAIDKAGAYAIQDETLHPVARLTNDVSSGNGCYCNVVGLPLAMMVYLLDLAGYPVDQIAYPAQCARCPDWD